MRLALKPRFGNIQVTSSPEDSIPIYLDDQNTHQKTPANLEEVVSGEHALKLQSSWYQPQTRQITVDDEKTTTAHFEMEPAFAHIFIYTDPEVDIILMIKCVDPANGRGGSWKVTIPLSCQITLTCSPSPIQLFVCRNKLF